MKYIILLGIGVFAVWQGYGLFKDIRERKKRKKEDNKDEKEQSKNDL